MFKIKSENCNCRLIECKNTEESSDISCGNKVLSHLFTSWSSRPKGQTYVLRRTVGFFTDNVSISWQSLAFDRVRTLHSHALRASSLAAKIRF